MASRRLAGCSSPVCRLLLNWAAFLKGIEEEGLLHNKLGSTCNDTCKTWSTVEVFFLVGYKLYFLEMHLENKAETSHGAGWGSSAPPGWEQGSHWMGDQKRCRGTCLIIFWLRTPTGSPWNTCHTTLQYVNEAQGLLKSFREGVLFWAFPVR